MVIKLVNNKFYSRNSSHYHYLFLKKLTFCPKLMIPPIENLVSVTWPTVLVFPVITFSLPITNIGKLSLIIVPGFGLFYPYPLKLMIFSSLDLRLRIVLKY